jgi:hypothetical protein
MEKGARFDPRAEVGFLVGYESATIFRIWIPRRHKVISVRDVTFDETRSYDPRVDSPQVILEQALVEYPVIEFEEVQEDVEDTIVVEVLEEEQEQEIPESDDTTEDRTTQEKGLEVQEPQHGLLTPGGTPDPDSTTPDPTTHGGSYREIGLDLDPQNIIHSTRERRAPTRRDVYRTSLNTPFSAFSVIQKKRRLTRKELPDPPKYWADLSGHPYEADFRAVTKREYEKLRTKGTFKYIPRKEAEAKKAFIIPTMWVFTYKFDANNYLEKFKARIVV